MAKKAAAWQDYTDEAYIEMIIKKMPQVTEEIAKPLSGIRSVVLISGNEKKSTSLKPEITRSQMAPLVKSLTGLELEAPPKK